MRKPTKIKTRPLPPIEVSGREIPRCEITVPLPRAWRKFMMIHRLDIEDAIATVVCNPFAWVMKQKVIFAHDFLQLWQGGHPDNPNGPGLGDVFAPSLADARCVKTPFPLRRDVLECLLTAAAKVDRPPCEVLAKILTRTLPLTAECPLPPPYRQRKASRPAPVENVIEFPTAYAHT